MKDLGLRVLFAIRRDFLGRLAWVVAGTAAVTALEILTRAYPQTRTTLPWLDGFLAIFGFGS